MEFVSGGSPRFASHLSQARPILSALKVSAFGLTPHITLRVGSIPSASIPAHLAHALADCGLALPHSQTFWGVCLRGFIGSFI